MFVLILRHVYTCKQGRLAAIHIDGKSLEGTLIILLIVEILTSIDGLKTSILVNLLVFATILQLHLTLFVRLAVKFVALHGSLESSNSSSIHGSFVNGLIRLLHLIFNLLSLNVREFLILGSAQQVPGSSLVLVSTSCQSRLNSLDGFIHASFVKEFFSVLKRFVLCRDSHRNSGHHGQ